MISRILIALWLLMTPAWAGSMVVLGAGGAALPGPPIVTFAGNGNNTGGDPNQAMGSITIGSSASQRMLVVAWSDFTNSPQGVVTSVTVTPNVGTANQAATIVTQQAGGSDPVAGLAYIVLDNTSTTATSVIVTVHFTSSTFNGGSVAVWTVPASGLVSTTPTGSAAAYQASGTTKSVTVNTSAGGFIVGYAANDVLTSQSGSIAGTETFTADGSNSFGGLYSASAHANGIAANPSSTITATFGTSGNIAIVAAAWR